jgi:1,4-alpha-glucan branching enzyme
MGTELGSESEWNHDRSLDWHLADDAPRVGLQRFLTDLNEYYRRSPSLWRLDDSPEGFQWIDCTDHDNSVMSFARSDGASHVLVVFNLTPVPREGYRIGAPESGEYVTVLCSDDPMYGGSEFETPKVIHTEPVGYHGFAQSLVLQLPPLCALILQQPD